MLLFLAATAAIFNFDPTTTDRICSLPAARWRTLLVASGFSPIAMVQSALAISLTRQVSGLKFFDWWLVRPSSIDCSATGGSKGIRIDPPAVLAIFFYLGIGRVVIVGGFFSNFLKQILAN